MTLSVLADRQTILRFRLRRGRLVDVHSLWSVSARGSSVAVALAAGAATLIIGGLQPFVIGVVSPPPPTASHP